MRRVEDFETWEASKRQNQGFIRTTGGGKTPVFFLPKEHNRTTTRLAEETWNAIDAEIKAAREVFEEELLRINARIDNPKVRDSDMDDDDDGEGDEGEEDTTKTPSTVVVMASTVSKPAETSAHTKTVDNKR